MDNPELRLNAMLSGNDATAIPPASFDEAAAVLETTKESYALGESSDNRSIVFTISRSR